MLHAKFHIAGFILYPPFLEMDKIWPFMAKHGPHLVLKISSSWILIHMPRDDPCQISHCWVYPVFPFFRNGQNIALYVQNIVLTGNITLLWPKHGPHKVPKIGPSCIWINMPRDVPCQISHLWVYPVAPFPRNGQLWPFTAKTRSSRGP